MAVMIAALNGHLDIVQFLAEQKADLDAKGLKSPSVVVPPCSS